MFDYINLKRGYLPKFRKCFFTVLFKINPSKLHFDNQSLEMLNYTNLKYQTLSFSFFTMLSVSRFLVIEKRATIIHLRLCMEINPKKHIFYLSSAKLMQEHYHSNETFMTTHKVVMQEQEE
ncbi:hypothetical protein C5167_003306 [Papaver somniferum]|uniref:Uncharacterized protein n=1 Tax=Papaver somniferum TaxID=3469 RepID=A0A4Y7L4C3_PAPSO|nr:hypothetical protein C5167_003306 [Papaver somniferum]